MIDALKALSQTDQELAKTVQERRCLVYKTVVVSQRCINHRPFV